MIFNILIRAIRFPQLNNLINNFLLFFHLTERVSMSRRAVAAVSAIIITGIFFIPRVKKFFLERQAVKMNNIRRCYQ